ncbi:MAG: DUF3817 domain-containing protein [Cyclobacteriaceae bacterium]
MMPDSSIGKLRVWGFLEGGSLIALVLVAMPLKYFWGIPEAVKYVGAAHGAFFVFYCIWLLVTSLELKWPIGTIAQAFVAAMIPGGTFWADKAIFKKYLHPVKSENQDSGTDREN